MSKRHPIDELFSQRLANSSASVPDDMWSRVAKSRQKQSRKKMLGWTTLSSLVLGLCVFSWWAIDNDPTLGFFPLKTDATTTTGFASTAAQSSTELSSVLPTVNTQHSGARDISPTQVASSLIASPTAETSPTVNTLSNAVTTNNSNTPVLTPQLADEKGAITDPIPTAVEKSTNELLTPIGNNRIENESSRVAGPHQRVRMGKVDRLPSKFFKLSDQADIKLFANHAPRCADFANPFFHLDAELLVGPAYARQMLVAKTNESLSHLQQRFDSEMAGISSSTSLRLAATSNTGLGLRSGFSYTQINEQFTHQVGSKIDVSIIFGPNGDVIGRDTIYTEAYEEKSTNRLKFVEIPLLLGYERKVGKLRIGLNAGAYLNLFFDAKGTVFSPATSEPIAFGQEGDLNRLPIFERRATAAWYGGLSLAYNLHSRYSLLAEPYFKTYPRALSSTGYDLAQNYWMTGLQVGLRMRL